MVLLSVVSSAYRIKLNCLVQFGMSFIYIRKNSSPKMEPWGTPVYNVYFYVLATVCEITCEPL